MSALVVGDAAVDITMAVPALPEADEKVVAVRENISVGGTGLNVAVALRHLGISSTLCCRIGDDVFARMILDYLLACSVNTDSVRAFADTDSFFTTSLVAQDGEKRMVLSSLADAMYPARADLPERMDRFRWCHTIPYDGDVAVELIERAREADVPVSLDLETATLANAPIGLLVKGAHTVFINRRAAGVIAATPAQACRVLHAAGAQRVVVTLGADGALFQANEQDRPVQIRPPVGVEVVDSTGAGDILAAAYIAAAYDGRALADCVRVGVVAGSLSCTGFGAHGHLPAMSEINDHVN